MANAESCEFANELHGQDPFRHLFAWPHRVADDGGDGRNESERFNLLINKAIFIKKSLLLFDCCQCFQAKMSLDELDMLLKTRSVWDSL